MSDILQGNFITWKLNERNMIKSASSSSFLFQKTIWCLKFTRAADSSYFLYLEKKHGGPNNYHAFHVTCFAQDVVMGGFAVNKTYCRTPYSSHKIWSISLEQVKRYVTNCEIELTIIFHGRFGFTLSTSTNADVDPTKSSLDPSFHSLSLDFGKLLKSGESTDVQLKCCGGVTRSAHKSVLMARSDVFWAMFRSDMLESLSGEVDITDLDPDLLDLFLEYLYTGKLKDFPSDRIADLYIVADRYAVYSLKQSCRDWMLQRVSAVDYQTLLILADSHMDMAFKNSLIDTICKNLEWLKNDAWIEFSKEHSVLANEVYRMLLDKTVFKK